MKIKSFIPFISWAIIFLILLGLPGKAFPEVPSLLEWLAWDKLIHFVAFGLFCFLFLWGVYQQIAIQKKHYWISFFIGVFYGGLTEVLQHYVFIYRSGSWLDFLVDIIGCIIGCCFFYLIYFKFSKRRKTFF